MHPNDIKACLKHLQFIVNDPGTDAYAYKQALILIGVLSLGVPENVCLELGRINYDTGEQDFSIPVSLN